MKNEETQFLEAQAVVVFFVFLLFFCVVFCLLLFFSFFVCLFFIEKLHWIPSQRFLSALEGAVSLIMRLS